MRLVIASIGRMKAGPERELLDRYVARSRAMARSIGITAVDILELEEGRSRSSDERRREEATGLASRIAPGSPVIVLDERGKSLSSPAFAEQIGKMIEGGVPSVVYAIGGPDGFDADYRDKATQVLSFGSATLPHQLLRVVLAEQIYRACTILSHHPYHRV